MEPEVIEEPVSYSTEHQHHYEKTEVFNEYGLRDVFCSCGHGVLIDPSIEVKNGVILWPSV